MTIKRKIYIAGKVTGLPRQEVMAKFRAAENKLSGEGWQVINPTLLISEDASWEDAMKVCFAALAECQAIYMLVDWRDSRGAVLEHSKACEMGMKIFYQNLKDNTNEGANWD